MFQRGHGSAGVAIEKDEFMKTPQSKIDLEQDSGRICRLLYTFHGVAWEPGDICEQLGMEPYRFAECYTWLLNSVYAYENYGSVKLTGAGEKYAKESDGSTSIGNPSDATKYKDEALTDFVEKMNPKVKRMCGYQSELKNAVLPTGKVAHKGKTTDDAIAEMDRWVNWKSRLCKQLKIDDEKLTRYMGEGRIQMCEECAKPGIMKKRGKNKDGSTSWRNKCQECRGKGK